MLKRLLTAELCLLLLLLSLLTPFQAYAAVTGDVESDPIILTQKQTKNTLFTKDGNVKYFKLIVKETGNVTISLSSDKLKKNVNIELFYDESGIYVDAAKVKYNKKAKTVKGSLTSSKLLMPGQYNIIVKTEKVSKDTKFTLKTSFKKYICDDKEPNNKEDLAQTMAVNSKKNVKKYQMLLSGEANSLDMIDYFTFNLKSPQKIKITASALGTERIRILIKKKFDTGTAVINTKEDEQYFVLKNGKSTFSHTTDTLPKGTYYVMVWLDEGQKIQVPYTIQAIYAN